VHRVLQIMSKEAVCVLRQAPRKRNILWSAYEGDLRPSGGLL